MESDCPAVGVVEYDEHDVAARTAGNERALTRGREILRTIREHVVGDGLREHAVRARGRCHRLREQHRQRIAEDLMLRVRVDVADQRTAGVRHEQRVAHGSVAIARPRRETPRTRAYLDRRVERRVAEIEDVELVPLDVAEIDAVGGRVIDRIGHESTSRERRGEARDDR